jgi:hypothetical protein
MENKDWQCQPRSKAEDCQIDHEQASTNNESLLRKCSICKTIKSH